MAEQSAVNQPEKHESNYWVHPAESLVAFGKTYVIPVYDSPAEGRIPEEEYLDMLRRMYESLPSWDLPFKQDGSVDLSKMKADFMRHHNRPYDVCWGTCQDGIDCPPPKRDNRCIVWVCHKVSENEPKPEFETWPIGKPEE